MTRGTRPFWVRLVAVGVVAVALASCNDDGEPITLPSPTAQTPASSPSLRPATSPTPEDPFAVPDEITADYVERVLNEIQRLNADVTKDILRRPVDEQATELPAEVRERLEAIYAEPLLTFNTRGMLALLRAQEERDGLLPAARYGQLWMSVEEVLATDSCVVARIERDYSETDAEPDDETSSLAFVFLVPSQGANSTGWRLSALLGSDAAPGSADEEELRTYTANDLTEQAPEACR